MGWGLLARGLSWTLEVPGVVIGIIQALNPTQSSEVQEVITVRLEWQVRRKEPQAAWQLGRLQKVATSMGKEPRTASENCFFF